MTTRPGGEGQFIGSGEREATRDILRVFTVGNRLGDEVVETRIVEEPVLAKGSTRRQDERPSEGGLQPAPLRRTKKPLCTGATGAQWWRFRAECSEGNGA